MTTKTESWISVENLRRDLRKMVLTGVGAAFMATEGAADMAKKWLARGEKAEPEIRKAVKKLADRSKTLTEKTDTLRAKVNGQVNKLVDALPIVSRKDVKELSRRIESLTTQVEALAKKRGK
ncbi:MAG: phasin family protein [Planctomycetes bacterium]|nr:phasin family protein [Planctomycetota bacterium]